VDSNLNSDLSDRLSGAYLGVPVGLYEEHSLSVFPQSEDGHIS
jgi:hypothetical protein